MIHSTNVRPVENGRFHLSLRGIKSAIIHLFDALELSRDARRPAWDFALEMLSLQRLGVTSSQLRWLVCKKLVEHGRETTAAGASERTFVPAGPMSFTRHSCFVINDRGAELARELKQAPAKIRQKQSIEANQKNTLTPVWNSDLGELRYQSRLVKRYKVPSPNQQRVLATFEEEGWPCRVDDPLPPHPELDPKRRLHDTIKSLNRHQLAPLLRFYGDGTGEGVRWGCLKCG